MKPLPDRGPTAVALLVGVGATIDVLADQVAQDREEVRHRLATTRFTATDTTDRDALLGHCTRLVYQLGELTTSQATRPPQSRRGPDRGLDVISAEGQRGAAHGGLDLRVETGHSLGLPSTHPHNDTGGGRAEPPPPNPHPAPYGRTSFPNMALTGGPFPSIKVDRFRIVKRKRERPTRISGACPPAGASIHHSDAGRLARRAVLCW